MSKRVRIKFNETRFSSGVELRSQTSIMVSNKFVESRALMPGMRVSLSIKAGCRRKMFSGIVTPNYHSCTCHTGVEYWSIEK